VGAIVNVIVVPLAHVDDVFCDSVIVPNVGVPLATRPTAETVVFAATHGPLT